MCDYMIIVCHYTMHGNNSARLLCYRGQLIVRLQTNRCSSSCTLPWCSVVAEETSGVFSAKVFCPAHATSVAFSVHANVFVFVCWPASVCPFVSFCVFASVRLYVYFCMSLCVRVCPVYFSVSCHPQQCLAGCWDWCHSARMLFSGLVRQRTCCPTERLAQHRRS